MTVALYIVGGFALYAAAMVALGAYLGHKLRERREAYQLWTGSSVTPSP